MNNRIEISSIGLLRIPISETEWVERYLGKFAYGNTLTEELRIYTKSYTKNDVANDLSIDVNLLKELNENE
tara:strand:- start:1261 stop:1473 length:213 start_codon:yes stop_codon:yes gene_type:complete